MKGTITTVPSADAAASAAALASSVSRPTVNTMPGSTTPERSGSRGRFRNAPASSPPVVVVWSVVGSIVPPGVSRNSVHRSNNGIEHLFPLWL